MPDDFLSVVFVYESVPESHYKTVTADLEYAPSGGQITNGDIGGIYHFLEAESGGVHAPDLPRIEFQLQESHFVEGESMFDEKYADRFERFLEVIRDFHGAGEIRPDFTYALQYHMEQGIAHIGTPPVDADSLAADEINYAVWLDVFPPDLVETYGRERLLDAPAWRTESWDDGSILVVAYEDPLSLGSFANLNAHLGLDDPGL